MAINYVNIRQVDGETMTIAATTANEIGLHQAVELVTLHERSGQGVKSIWISKRPCKKRAWVRPEDVALLSVIGTTVL